MTKILWSSASAILALTSLAHPVLAATPSDAFQVGYAANLSVGKSVINITSAGSLEGLEPVSDICANVYVFAQDQQLISCCACPLTPNHLKTVSYQDLISNTLTPGVPTGVTVALLATANPGGGTCDAANANAATLAPGMRAWGTVVHAAPGGGYGVTENPFLPASLSAGELAKMTSFCGFIEADGSFYGICKSCSEGAAGAAKQ